MSRVVKLADEAHEHLEKAGLNYPHEGKYKAYQEAVEAIKRTIEVTFGASIYLGYLEKVVYDHKSDRYAATFGQSRKHAVLKVNTAVAQFLTEHLKDSGGYWQGRMEEGVLVNVYFFQN